jgi:thiol-disulfide isomerase/thioredoxin
LHHRDFVAAFGFRRYDLKMMGIQRLVAGGVAAVLAGTIGAPFPSSAAEISVLPSFQGATGWLNSEPRTDADLRGKVVVVEFWTYSCINWLRTLPYVRAWAEQYKKDGLVVIGVHSPEFPFEKDAANVRRAVAEMKITYPIALDNNFAIWQAFDNEYWPALYFIDAQGRIRHHQFGEGDYEQSEAVIRQLLTEAGVHGADRERAVVHAQGIEAPPDLPDLQSAENYVGYERTQDFTSADGELRDVRHAYSAPARLTLNSWALSGNWTIGSRAAVLDSAGGRIAYQFHARDLHLVMGAPGRAVRFRVLLEGQPPGDAHGVDVDREGYGTVTEPRLYQLIRQPKPIADRRFEIEFLDAGVAAYSFTFG